MDNQTDNPNPTPTEPVTDPAEVVAPTEAPTETSDTEPAPVEAQPVASPEPEAAPAPSGGKGKRILLVEDDDNLATVYSQRLDAEGFNVKRVPNGEDALSSALEFHPDLILLDVMMPKVSGFDVLDILRNTPETTNVKIIMLTALSQESDRERAKTLGVDDFLVKSQVVIADVVNRIKFHLGM